MNFYFEAANILDRLDAKQGSIKGLIATVPEKNRKRTAALVIETLKYKAVLTDIIEAATLLKEERKITTKNLALVLVHDLLLANGGIQAGDGPVKQAVLRHKTRLNSEFQRIKIKLGVKTTKELARSQDERAGKIPRYVRVNTACWNTEDAVRSFISRGYVLSGPFDHPKGFAKDAHIPDLLLFPPDTQFVEISFYREGKIILQDKASCFPAFILAPPAEKGTVAIDATAAPGNKTSHLAALMKNKGKVFAFERDRKRYATLQTMLSRAKCENVEAVNADFLTISPDDPKYSAVTHILLDPSCSGSGIVNRLDHLLESDGADRYLIAIESESLEDEEERLHKLASFQLMMIRHAMKFPAVKRIVYSTCSVHAIENENVVKEALKTEECNAGPFRLAPRNMVLPTWPRRGLPEEMDSPDEAASLVRCSPGDDATNGFFVCLFMRVTGSPGSEPSPSTKRTHEADGLELDRPSRPSKKRKKKRKKDTQSES
ncbi:S-adenosyl-L-methionine-dependent methyltransferase [Irpex rosettiformis]|uniref:S-adenosyl-L-methionine-dependent methyltransferase n=1 Tax=Irpex rosettiformis TaxID=378272 RepID=A0ACB8TZY3_9APHY|nr:S-adenosyl-L-methionine-dependent methyltransferase [Irpex rosettiformis]